MRSFKISEGRELREVTGHSIYHTETAIQVFMASMARSAVNSLEHDEILRVAGGEDLSFGEEDTIGMAALLERQLNECANKLPAEERTALNIEAKLRERLSAEIEAGGNWEEFLCYLAYLYARRENPALTWDEYQANNSILESCVIGMGTYLEDVVDAGEEADSEAEAPKLVGLPSPSQEKTSSSTTPA